MDSASKQKQNRIIIILGHFFDQNCPFFELPKELIQIIATNSFYSIIKNFTKYGCSADEDFDYFLSEVSAVPNTLRSVGGHMATVYCECMGEEIIAWEVLNGHFLIFTYKQELLDFIHSL